ncbi:hypothetical protein [Inquilinus limosus]|uniref:hypothetical protein n=1 Tax=Inquilinus limosus TaxID=171674 RepID=UPI00047BB09A|nr:hypothetical protein [Inquilinus limosus]
MYDVSIQFPQDGPQRPEDKKHAVPRRAPRKPNSQMLAAGARAGGVSPDVAWRIYGAMLDAAGLDPSDTVFVAKGPQAA